MRIPINILIGFLAAFVPVCGFGGIADHVDSVMLNIDHEAKVKTLLWLEVDQLDDIVEFPDHQHFVISEGAEITDIPLAHNISLAGKLDRSMNPGTIQKLPDLSKLSAINDQQVLTSYFGFLRDLGSSMNYQYFILPESQNPREIELLNQLLAFDPDFFISRSQIRYGLPDKRKETKVIFENYDYWVVGPKDFEEAGKLVRKLDEKILLRDKEEVIRQALFATLVDNIPQEPEFPSSLKLAIERSSVALIEKGALLPLNVDTLCLLTLDPYGDLANMLRNYAYVMTETEDILRSNAPILADHNPILHEPYLQRDIIYTGPINNFDTAFFDAGLIVNAFDDAYIYILPQQLFGAISVNGSITSRFDLLDQYHHRTLAPQGKLGFAPAESVGLERPLLDSITAIIQEGIDEEAFPGCQLALAVGGSVVYNKAFGYLTYENLIPVYPSTIFDLASVTKVAATSLMAMKLVEEGQLDLNKPISYYLPEYFDSNKKDITIKAVMAHQAGLLPYVPFWKRVLSGDFLDPFYYESIYNESINQRSYVNLQPTSLLKDSLNQWIRTSSLLKYDSVPYYSYSDIGFMILQQVLEEITCMPMDHYLYEYIYQPLGLRKTVFNPRKFSFNLFEIAPTEYDSYYRSEQIWGDVHDRNAAILDGVAGHAGLFSNARDMLVLMQMALQGGQYNGLSFFSRETLDLFNRQYFPDNRRGLGWDKKSEIIENVSRHASEESFGHTGFTGTMVWVDPEYDLVFVFLSNRIHPNANNRKLNELDIRTRIQDIVYEAIQARKD